MIAFLIFASHLLSAALACQSASPRSAWSEWVPGSCSVTCGKGWLNMTRTCRNQAGKIEDTCPGEKLKKDECSANVTCPAFWGDWDSWLGCDGCGDRTRTRTRWCITDGDNLCTNASGAGANQETEKKACQCITHCSTCCYPTLASGRNRSQHPCVFPFIYEGDKFYECTLDYSDQDRKWCSTKVDADGVHVRGEKRWGFCLEEDAGCCTNPHRACP